PRPQPRRTRLCFGWVVAAHGRHLDVARDYALHQAFHVDSASPFIVPRHQGRYGRAKGRRHGAAADVELAFPVELPRQFAAGRTEVEGPRLGAPDHVRPRAGTRSVEMRVESNGVDN